MLQISGRPRALRQTPATGEQHNAAPRNLANKLLGRLWWCLTDHELWDEIAAWPNASAHQFRWPLDTRLTWDVYLRCGKGEMYLLVRDP